MFELDRTENILRDALAEDAVQPVGGWLTVPNGPGLGISIDRAVLDRFTVG